MQHVISNSTIADLIHSDYYHVPAATKKNTSVFHTFIAWCEGQEENRILWMVLTYLGQIGLALPCAMAAIIFMGGNNFNLIMLACLINVPVLAINLAAQPTKITLPALFFALLADAVIIVSCAVFFFATL